jgi:hypothetical protein
MNPFRAQIILTLIELKEALGTSLEELKQKFRWILPSALVSFRRVSQTLTLILTVFSRSTSNTR